MNIWHLVLKIDVFALTIPLCFCENIQGRRKAVFGVRRIFMHANAIFIRVNEIYAWCGQTPCVMSVTAVRQRASHVPLGYPMSYAGNNRMGSGSEGTGPEQE